MKVRKTVEVENLRNKVNKYLASDNPQITDEARLAVCSLLESVLHETGNYHGFNYISWLDSGCRKWREDGCPEDKTPYLGNESRRFYYGPGLY